MWFRFPSGAESISVELQQFGVEWTDPEGNNYFRAPDHFAGRILDIPGFVAAPQPPEGAPADLPKIDPMQDAAIGQLGGQVGALRAEIENLKGVIAVVSAERDDLKLQLHEAQVELADLKDEAAAAPPPAVPVKK